MSTEKYEPAKIWTWNTKNGGRFANINRPIAGPTSEKELPVGEHPFQLYSLGTPNGVKVTVMLEELLALGHKGAEYDAWITNIGDGDQFTSGFVEVNPNSKNSSTDGSQRKRATSGFRVWRNVDASGREIWRVPS
jgi:GST-like protein